MSEFGTRSRTVTERLVVLSLSEGTIFTMATDGSDHRVIVTGGHMPDGVAVVDTVKHKMLPPISIGKPGIIKPMDVILSPDATRLYVSTGRGHLVFTVDTATNKVLNSVEVGGRPWGIALSPDAKTLYSSNGSSNDVSVVDLATNTVTKKIKAGTGPWGVIVLER